MEFIQDIETLLSIGCLKVGNFTLKSGQMSHFYCDLRVLINYPDFLAKISEHLWSKYATDNELPSKVCGVPYTALPIATIYSIKHSIPMVLRRKEAKSYGTKKLLEGVITGGESCLIIEDVVTTGSSVIETADILRQAGLKVDSVIVLIDREQGAAENLKSAGIKLTSLFTLTDITSFIRTNPQYADVLDALEKKGFTQDDLSLQRRQQTYFSTRIEHAGNKITAKLLKLIQEKKTNLCISVDLKLCQHILDILDQIGPFICVAKTHIDVLDDLFDFGVADFTHKLKQLAHKHNFMLMEDRKFSDIGNTFLMQICEGPFKISSWADLVTAHSISGPGMLQSLKSSRLQDDEQHKLPCIVFVAEMSSSNNLITEEYTQHTIDLGRKEKDLVTGFVYQHRECVVDDSFVYFMPGVSLETGTDGGDQNYTSVENSVIDHNSDIIIVGRAILNSKDQMKTVLEFKNRAWNAFASKYDDLM